MKKIKKMLAMFLVLALVVTILPSGLTLEAEAAENSCVLEVVKDGAPLRTQAAQEGKTILKTKSGDCLTCVGSIRNRHGNLWYTIKYGDQVGYIFSGNVKEHHHNMKLVEGSNNVFFCKCGHYEVYQKKNGVVRTSALVLGGELLAPEAVAAAQALAKGAAAVAGVAGAAAPVVVVVGIGAAILLVAQINATSTAVPRASIEKTLGEYQGSRYKVGNYYFARREGDYLLIGGKGISQENAERYLLARAMNLVNFVDAYPDAYNREKRAAGWTYDIYTPVESNARSLANRMRAKGLGIRRDEAQDKGYFNHYNVFHRISSKVGFNAHIFFGVPVFLNMPSA